MQTVAVLAEQHTPIYRADRIGLHALSNAELVMLALRIDPLKAEQILAMVEDSLRGLAFRAEGIEPSLLNRRMRMSLRAIFEIGLRYQEERVPVRLPIRNPTDVVAILGMRMQELVVEEMHVLILDAQHRLVRDVTITRGVLNATLVTPREVFALAIAERAAAIICVHNHPSGDPKPSNDDLVITEQLVAAGRIIGIPVHDHVIIGRGSYASLAESRLL